jgi:hypothetical protein
MSQSGSSRTLLFCAGCAPPKRPLYHLVCHSGRVHCKCLCGKMLHIDMISRTGERRFDRTIIRLDNVDISARVGDPASDRSSRRTRRIVLKFVDGNSEPFERVASESEISSGFACTTEQTGRRRRERRTTLSLTNLKPPVRRAVGNAFQRLAKSLLPGVLDISREVGCWVRFSAQRAIRV